MSWDDATAFFQKLTEIERKAGKLKAEEEYRLPTEAEWEYACRAGTTTAFSFGEDESKLGEYAWFRSNADNAGEKYAHAVGLKKPNPWGLHDMHGNVFEWCSDWYGNALPGGADPVGPGGGSDRVGRGGGWRFSLDYCRSAFRLSGVPSARIYDLGFRVARSQSDPSPVATNPIGMELIEIPIGQSIGSQQMLSKFLDEPWTKYETAIATAEKSVVSTLTEEFVRQFEAAAALGDFNLSESIEAQKKAFENNGTLPTGQSFQPTLQAIKKTGEDAKTQLKNVYSNAISDLTKQKRLAEARIVNDEMQFVFRDAKLLSPIRKKGYFRMGEGAGVAVTLTKPFALGKTEVTQGQWQSVMGTERWKGQQYVQADKDCPATYVDWDDATAFCQKLTDLERKAGKLKANEEYRLPTEAEWECACRAGNQTAFSFGDDGVFADPRAKNNRSGQESQLGEYAWFKGNTRGEEYAHKVGMKKPNPWGLYDMHGNVYEWCSDWYDKKLSGGTDPVGPGVGSNRVLRGGGFSFDPGYCRSADRNISGLAPSFRIFYLGFRVARSQSAQ